MSERNAAVVDLQCVDWLVDNALIFRLQETHMSDCCSSSGHNTAHPQKYPCPINGLACLEVSARTIAHHIKGAWEWSPTATRYFFCDDPECDVVYFGEDGSTILNSRLRLQPGPKDRSDEGLLCYCFGVTRGDFQRNSATREFVILQTNVGQCSCETSNPSGRCCLRDFPKPAHR